MLSSSSFSTDGNNNSHEDNKDEDRHRTLDHRHHGGGHHLSPASYQLQQQAPHELIPHRLQTTVSSHLLHEDQNHRQMRQLLLSCAELVSKSDFSSAHRLVSLLSTSSSPFGDSTERLVHQFSKALSLRINRHYNNTNTATATATTNFIRSNLLTDSDHHQQYYSAQVVAKDASSATLRTSSTIAMVNLLDNPSVSTSASDAVDLEHHQIHELHNDEAVAIDNNDINSDLLQSSYLYLNQITPFIRFSHLTANQAILEAIEGQESIHILDFDTMQGVQWPPLMQAIADRYYTSSSLSSYDSTSTSSSLPHPPVPPMIRITGTGQDIGTLRKTGERLQRFAQSLGLRFQFHPLILLVNDPSSVALQLPSAIALLPHETLAVNCVLYLHKLLSSRDDHHDHQYYNQQSNTTQYYYSSSSSSRRDDDGVCLFLRTIKSMNPKVVTVAEREASNNHPNFMKRFLEALDHYTALFNSLEATLPPNSQERLTVEQVWFGREIADIVSAEGEERSERHERLESYWVEKLTSSGFTKLPLSPYALSQAKLLLRLHYPSEGYQLQILNDSFFLGWQNQSLFTVSSWY
ncbi:hypothetical protein MKW94_020611 [Papaver nudicaule]|uniref:Uncharacterized protein n=1 Tax=Papaver nudicaule TaxID=74823 RepID=A0AA41RYG0_PAPNU|nr:hypothetical protein [Papaver nudicaule]